ncbi:sigma-70 family RNA polymerase sigma factor [Halocynthiibacter sp.]|uniref:sigma-70 family RNA polymerase sigma factor n=1 Tax=Halocynthiibacter sp. TaxID=1979210 RepID=UPI003C42F755
MAMPFDCDTAEDETRLLMQFASGDRNAARVLTQRFAPIALGFAMRRLSNRSIAEDIAQEALLRLWKVSRNWEAGRARISTWLYQVVSNLCVDWFRRQKDSGQNTDDLPEPMAPAEDGAEAQMQQNARRSALYQALETLPERQRIAVEMRHIEGYSNPEIAAVLGVGVEAVESLTARGKRALAVQLAGKQDELGFNDD